MLEIGRFWSCRRANTGVLDFLPAGRCPFIRPALSIYTRVDVGDTDMSEPADIVPDVLFDPSIAASVEESLHGPRIKYRHLYIDMLVSPEFDRHFTVRRIKSSPGTFNDADRKS